MSYTILALGQSVCSMNSMKGAPILSLYGKEGETRRRHNFSQRFLTTLFPTRLPRNFYTNALSIPHSVMLQLSFPLVCINSLLLSFKLFFSFLSSPCFCIFHSFHIFLLLFHHKYRCGHWHEQISKVALEYTLQSHLYTSFLSTFSPTVPLFSLFLPVMLSLFVFPPCSLLCFHHGCP